MKIKSQKIIVFLNENHHMAPGIHVSSAYGLFQSCNYWTIFFNAQVMVSFTLQHSNPK